MAIKVMVNGLPGSMAKEVISAALNRGLEVIPFSLTGEAVEQDKETFRDIEFTLLKPGNRASRIFEAKETYGGFITIDYTHPSAVNSNAEFYIENRLPFVMGTTGGDRKKLMEDTAKSQLYGIIAPNMAKQIVGLQSMLEMAAREFPGLYGGYSLSVVESHQKTKADTSGTAKAMVDNFNTMGIIPITYDNIEKVRNEDEMESRMKVPAEYLTGHAFHTYRLESADGTVAFEYRHNVCGRSIYAEGTIDAVTFLHKKIAESSDKKLFNMIDVLKSGAMS